MPNNANKTNEDPKAKTKEVPKAKTEDQTPPATGTDTSPGDDQSAPSTGSNVAQEGQTGLSIPKEPKGRQADLSRSVTINWPSNSRVVSAPQFVELPMIKLSSGQVGFFGKTPEGYVHERLDIHPVVNVENETILAVETEDGALLGAFAIHGKKAERVSVQGKEEVDSR